MKKQQVADFFNWFTTILALDLVVESIYDGLAIWRILLNFLLFGLCAAGIIVRRLERRKKDSV